MANLSNSSKESVSILDPGAGIGIWSIAVIEFKRHVDDIAWETEVWVSEIPNHMIHFNGDKFLKMN